MDKKRIGIIIGSIRKGSMSMLIGEAIMPLFPKNVEVELVELGNLPLYNPDYDTPEGTLPEYQAFRDKIKNLDGYVFITPEHNRSIPAALKNAVDIASRPFGKSVWGPGKTGMIISQSLGAIGGFGANHHLRQALVFLDIDTVQQPEMYIGFAGKLFQEGEPANPDTLKFLQSGINALMKKMDK